MSVRSRTLRHLSRILAGVGTGAAALGNLACDPVGPPEDPSRADDGVAEEPATPPKPHPVPPPPVVCDPMPAPYCPPDLGDALDQLGATASWSGEDVVIRFTGFHYGMGLAGPVKLEGAEVVGDPKAATTTVVVHPTAKKAKVTLEIACEGRKKAGTWELIPGVPGGAPKITRE